MWLSLGHCVRTAEVVQRLLSMWVCVCVCAGHGALSGGGGSPDQVQAADEPDHRGLHHPVRHGRRAQVHSPWLELLLMAAITSMLLAKHKQMRIDV